MSEFQFQLAPSDSADWHSLHDLLTECFAFMEGRIDPPSSLSRMTPEILSWKAQEETFLVAFRDSQLVACGYLKETGTAIYLGKLAVKPGFRRQGLLRSMILISEELARQRRKSMLQLQTRIELTENHRTFEALGFVRTGETAHPGHERDQHYNDEGAVGGLRQDSLKQHSRP